MTAKSSVSTPPTPQYFDMNSPEIAKAIKADAFDQFIESQLQKHQLQGEQPEFEVVCHVY